MRRTHRIRRVAAAVALGIGGVAGVIGVTAGTAGATTITKTMAAVGPPPSVPSTATDASAAGVKVTLAAGSVNPATVTVTLTNATFTASHLPTATCDYGTTTGATTTCTLTLTAPGSVKVAITTTTTTHNALAHTVTLSAVKVDTSGTTGAITASSPAGSGYTAAGPVTIANSVSTAHGTIKASSAPSVAKTGTGQKAGTLTITLPATLTTRTLTLTTGATSGTVDWQSETVAATGGHTTTVGGNGSTHLTIVVTGHATADTITVSSILYTTTTALGTVTVTPAMPTGIPTFSPTKVVNATAPAAPAGNPVVHTLTATSTLPLGKGASGAAGNWTATESALTSGTATAAKAEGWTKTHTVTITVAPFSGANCATTSYVLLTGTPKATVGTTKTVSTTPTVSVSTAAAAPCSVNDHNVVSVTFTNSGSFTGVTGTFSIMLSGVKYTIGKTTPTGNVSVGAAFTSATTPTFQAASTTGATTGPSNATVTTRYVTANTPAVNVPKTALDAAISPINLVETAPGTIPAGHVCIELSTASNVFNTAAKAAAKVANSGDGTVTPKVTYETTTGTAAATTASAKYAVFKVTLSSTKTATTYEVSGLAVNAGTTAGGVKAIVYPTSTNCDLTATVITATKYGTATAYTVQNTSQQIYGQTADATAAKLLETTYKATSSAPTSRSCAGGNLNSANDRPVVLATTANFPDALSSQYLAGYLKTGTLLTPTAKLSTVTLKALRTEGITNVYVIGGPLAVSATVVNQLMTTPAYNCGGTAQLKTGTHTLFLQVTRIYGETQYDTAQQVAQFVPTSDVASVSVVGSYAGTNATGGTGKYNQTKGSASTAPSSGAPLPTAILASGVHFQDAMSASPVAYKPLVGHTTGFPVLLTTTTTLPTAAKGAIANLGIKQVILMGGQLAVTNTVEKALQALGVSVLRIAGQTYTATATDLATFELNEVTGGLGLGWKAGTTTHLTGTVTVARGNGFTDGLAGAVISGFNQEPLVLTETPTTVGQYLTTFLKEAGKTGTGIGTATAKKHLTTLVVFGGPDAVSPAAISAMETDLQN